jgi:hypothetical protein
MGSVWLPYDRTRAGVESDKRGITRSEERILELQTGLVCRRIMQTRSLRGTPPRGACQHSGGMPEHPNVPEMRHRDALADREY